MTGSTLGRLAIATGHAMGIRKAAGGNARASKSSAQRRAEG